MWLRWPLQDLHRTWDSNKPNWLISFSHRKEENSVVCALKRERAKEYHINTAEYSDTNPAHSLKPYPSSHDLSISLISDGGDRCIVGLESLSKAEFGISRVCAPCNRVQTLRVIQLQETYHTIIKTNNQQTPGTVQLRRQTLSINIQYAQILVLYW